MSFPTNKLLIVIIVVFAVGVVLLFLFKVDITKYFEFLPDFDANKEDKIVEDSFFQGGSPGEKTGATRDYGFEEGNEVE